MWVRDTYWWRSFHTATFLASPGDCYRHLPSELSAILRILLRMGNIETVLASSIVAVSWAAGVTAATMWYGGAATPVG